MRHTILEGPNKGKRINVPDEYLEKAKHNLGLGLEEAISMYLDDEGFTTNPIVEELTAKAKGAGVGAKATGERKERKAPVRKPDEIKRAIVAQIAYFIEQTVGVSGLEITNIERMIAFDYAGDKYEITLTKKRKSKE